MGGNHPREFKKRNQFIISARDEPLPVIAERVRNKDRSPVRVYSCHTAPSPTGLAQIVGSKTRCSERAWRGDEFLDKWAAKT